jgi:hypothetical protein
VFSRVGSDALQVRPDRATEQERLLRHEGGFLSPSNAIAFLQRPPSSSKWPVPGGTRPVTTSISVLLPAPDCPPTAVICALRYHERDVPKRCVSAQMVGERHDATYVASAPVILSLAVIGAIHYRGILRTPSVPSCSASSGS